MFYIYVSIIYFVLIYEERDTPYCVVYNYDGDLNGVFDEVDVGLGNSEGEQRQTPTP